MIGLFGIWGALPNDKITFNFIKLNVFFDLV